MRELFHRGLSPKHHTHTAACLLSSCMTHRHLRISMSKTTPQPSSSSRLCCECSYKPRQKATLPLGGPIFSKSQMVQIGFFLFMPSHVDIQVSVTSHLDCFSSLLTSPSATSRHTGSLLT